MESGQFLVSGIAVTGECLLAMLVELILPLANQRAVDAEIASGLGVALLLGQANGFLLEGLSCRFCALS